MKLSLLFVYLFLHLITFRINAQKETVSGIIMYTFHKFGNFNCEVESKIIVDNKVYDFFDSRYLNYILINQNKHLEHWLGKDSLYRYFIFEADSLKDLNYSSFKKRSVNGWFIYSPVIYTNNENDKLYIIFNFYGDVIRYKNVHLENQEIKYKNYICCPSKLMQDEKEYFVLSKVITLTQLDEQKILNLGLLKSSNERIDLFICE